MKVRRSFLHVVYPHFKDKRRINPVCVTNFTCILLENQVRTAVCFAVSSKSVYKNYTSVVHFCCFFGSLATFWQYEEFDDRYPKQPMSLTKTDIDDYIYQSIYIITVYHCIIL